MKFEFDPAKSSANLTNRFEALVRVEEETRNIVIGVIDGKHWTAIITYRADRVRMISVRRARELEIACYEG